MHGRILSIPNLLTLARILLTPFIVYAIVDNRPVLALLLMGVAGFTDMLDGAIARYFNQRSTVGAYLDPLADKLMLIRTIVTLFLLGSIPLFLFLAVIFRDVVIVVGAIVYELVTHKLEMQPTLTSKATTFMQIMLVLVSLANSAWGVPPTLNYSVIWMTFGLTCISGLQYMVVWLSKAATSEQG
ncbi:MAG TPA: CDP-alcohol phosphatidyltransferase family protein [Mariprofundaceae bacterium]|nr:CDP-alcohol phosphatidyltransferase family protein [Mariprofundaceae bacterium]